MPGRFGALSQEQMAITAIGFLTGLFPTIAAVGTHGRTILAPDANNIEIFLFYAIRFTSSN